MVLSTELRQEAPDDDEDDEEEEEEEEEEEHDPNVDDSGARSKALGQQFRVQSRGRQEMRNAMQVRVRLFVGVRTSISIPKNRAVHCCGRLWCAPNSVVVLPDRW